MEKEKKESKNPLRGYPYRQKESSPPHKPPSKSNISNPGPIKKEKKMKPPPPPPTEPPPPSYGVYSRK